MVDDAAAQIFPRALWRHVFGAPLDAEFLEQPAEAIGKRLIDHQVCGRCCALGIRKFEFQLLQSDDMRCGSAHDRGFADAEVISAAKIIREQSYEIAKSSVV